MEVLELPFRFLRVPNLKLKLPQFNYPSPMLVFSLVFFSYFLVLSGIIYDIIVEPPSIGSTQEGGRINGQFIIEGLSAGMLFVIGGVGFIFLDRANEKIPSPILRYMLLGGGAMCVLVAYNLCIVFLKMKETDASSQIPGYLA